LPAARHGKAGAGIMVLVLLAMSSTVGNLHMNTRTLRWTALALSFLLLAGCKEKHDPLKPTVAAAAAVTAHA
jgi:hypothetical protein